MAEFVIFNPNTGYNAALGFNPNWNYGGPRKPGSNYTTVRPRFGRWQTRSVGDAGYRFDMVFVDRPIQQVWYIKRFYEQFQTGFFTVVDYDNEGRQHVGRFTAYADDTHTANLKFTIRVTFEEIPGCPMQNYPSNWFHESHMIYPVDGWITTQGTPNLLVATSGAGWTARQAPVVEYPGALPTPVPPVNDPSTYQAYAPATNAGDFAQMEYTGWGWRMLWTGSGPGSALFNIFFDGVEVVSGVLASGTTQTQILDPRFVESAAPVTFGVFWTMQDVPLGRHRVKFVSTGTQSIYQSGTAMFFPALQVMH